MDERAIGVFDSGFGGLTVARAVIDLLPWENLVYIGDTGRYPYGPRHLDQVRCFSRQITAKLVKEHDVKMVVVACNTAAAAGLDGLSERFGIPVVTVIEPGLRAALRATSTGRVGVIGTVGTVSSGAYQRAMAALDPSGAVDLTCAACPGFVEFVERGETDSDQVYVLAERLLAPVRMAKRRHPSPWLYSLSFLGPHHQRRGRARRRPGEFGRRNRVRTPGPANRQQPRPITGPVGGSHLDLVWRREHVSDLGPAAPGPGDRRGQGVGSSRRVAATGGLTFLRPQARAR